MIIKIKMRGARSYWGAGRRGGCHGLWSYGVSDGRGTLSYWRRRVWWMSVGKGGGRREGELSRRKERGPMGPERKAIKEKRRMDRGVDEV